MDGVVQIAWGVAPGDDAKVIPKDDALQRVAKAVTVYGYTLWRPGDLAVAFGMPRYTGHFKWHKYSSAEGEVICVSKGGETYWVQNGLPLESIR